MWFLFCVDDVFGIFKIYFCISLGMNYDVGRCYGSDVGIMGGYGVGWSLCSVNDLNVFL